MVERRALGSQVSLEEDETLYETLKKSHVSAVLLTWCTV
jgi:hypothetical protein